MLYATIMFRRVLVANRGEIAVRIIRSLRYLGIHSIAIFGKEDRISLPTRIADESIYIPHEDPLASYLDIEAIVSAALETRADAVHPGYGFLSENPTFAERLEEEGIAFIGPSPEALRILGDKIEARKVMNQAGIPVAKGSDGPISSFEEAKLISRDIGFPLIIKAASGGGGIGMQLVESQDDFDSALRLCQSSAESAFGDDRVFIEKFIQDAQHIEFQVLGDGKNAIHLGERFCSIQRRHQKILEEAPWLSESEREDIGSLVVSGAKSIGYKGLATFEFLRNSDGEFFFMEVNPRVQVEHTVTEFITGLDLVSLGVQVAAGMKIPFKQSDINYIGHAIQARINAENPRTLIPSPGKIWECHFPGGPGVRIDTHAFSGYEMPEGFDSLLAKIISWAPSRQEAIFKLDTALDETIILGVDTLIPLHRQILNEKDFKNREITIDYLQLHPELQTRSG